MSYYKDQLSFVNDGDRKLKITSDNNTRGTNWLSLNDESATELVKWLKSNYNIEDDSFGGGWNLQDIEDHAKNEGYELSEDEIKQVRDIILANFDSTIGINWDTISDAISQIVPENSSYDL